jgi:broad specificity phosphatase PhoE
VLGTSRPPLPHVHLVRHGEVQNPSRVNYGCLPGFSLTERGRAQAWAAASFLRSETGGNAVILSSPLERARETAEILLEGLAPPGMEIRIDDRLVEAGSWREGLPRRFHAPSYVRRALDAAARAKSETPRKVAMRMKAAIADVLETMSDDTSLVVVSHQVPIWMARVAFERRLGAADEKLLPRLLPWLYVRTRCEHASVTTLRFDGTQLANVSYWEPALG